MKLTTCAPLSVTGTSPTTATTTSGFGASGMWNETACFVLMAARFQVAGTGKVRAASGVPLHFRAACLTKAPARDSASNSVVRCSPVVATAKRGFILLTLSPHFRMPDPMNRKFYPVFLALLVTLMILREIYGAPQSPNVWEMFGW